MNSLAQTYPLLLPWDTTVLHWEDLASPGPPIYMARPVLTFYGCLILFSDTRCLPWLPVGRHDISMPHFFTSPAAVVGGSLSQKLCIHNSVSACNTCLHSQLSLWSAMRNGNLVWFCEEWLRYLYWLFQRVPVARSLWRLSTIWSRGRISFSLCEAAGGRHELWLYTFALRFFGLVLWSYSIVLYICLVFFYIGMRIFFLYFILMVSLFLCVHFIAQWFYHIFCLIYILL